MNKTYSDMYLTRFGKIMSNYSIAGLCVMAAIIFSTIFSGLYYVLGIFFAFAVIIFTVGTIFITVPDFFSRVAGGGEALVTLSAKAFQIFPYALGVTFVTSIISLVLLCLQKEKRSVPRIVASSIILALTIIGGIVYFSGGLGQ